MIKHFMQSRTPQQLSFMMNSYKLHWFFVPAIIFSQTIGLSIGLLLLQLIILAFQTLANSENKKRMEFLHLQMKILTYILDTMKRSRNE